jgi:hypothetical protein
MTTAAPVVQHQPPTTRPSPSVTAERWHQLLATYRHRAVNTLAQHTPRGRHCASCAQPWPCAQAINAALILEL